MRRMSTTHWFRALALATLILGASAAPAAAQEFVDVTAVTFDRVAHLCGESTASGCVVVSGTITCAATGPAELVDVSIRQRGIDGISNLDLLDFPCSTQPRPFTAIAETFGCGFPGERTGCFKPGPATVSATVSGVVVAEARVLVRPG